MILREDYCTVPLLEMLVVLGCGGKEIGNNWQIDAYLEDKLGIGEGFIWNVTKTRYQAGLPGFLAGSAEHMVSFTLMETTRGEWEGGGGMKKGRGKRQGGRKGEGEWGWKGARRFSEKINVHFIWSMFWNLRFLWAIQVFHGGSQYTDYNWREDKVTDMNLEINVMTMALEVNNTNEKTIKSEVKRI